MQNKILLSIFTLTITLFILTGSGFSAKNVTPGDYFIYVFPNGDDSASGDEVSPVKTLAAAQKLVRKIAGKKTVNVILKPGTYYLDKTIIFTPADSGTKDAPVVWRAENEGTVTISGGRMLELKWKPYQNGIYQASFDDDLKTDQLFINGRRIHMARYPNYDEIAKYYNGFSADAISRLRVQRWKDPAGGIIHAMHKSLWGDMQYVITGKNKDGDVTYKGGWQNNRQSEMHSEYRFVENIFEELDAPGEWFYDSKTKTLYVYSPKDVDLNSAKIEAAGLPHLFEFKGNSQNPVKFIELQNLTMTHTARTFMENREPLLRSDWTTYRGGAVFFDGAEDCAVKDCLLDQVGGNGVFVSKYNRCITISGCEIADAGASAVSFVGDPNSLRTPLFQYNLTQTLEQMDHTPGPKGLNYPADCLVDDCLIYRNGRFEKQTAGVNISMSGRITVRHCSIYDVPRAGINICDGDFGGHVIEWCDVFDTVKETGDHGSFNSWGRDRFWNQDRNVTNQWIKQFPDMPRWDCIEAITIRNSRWRCDHGWDIDLDDGSSNYEIYNNLLLNGGLKLREGFNRKVYNNITVNNSLHPHCWYLQCGDQVTSNIFMGSYKPAIMPNGKWGKQVDRNFFTTSDADRIRFAVNGCDANSLVGDAQFIDPAKCDYRVKEGSAALKIGFKNFPMDSFGVKKPSLKAKAAKPVLPGSPEDIALKKSLSKQSKVSAQKAKWNGISMRNLTGLGDISATGLGDTKGALIEAIEPYSSAAKKGFQVGDVIIAVGKIKVKNVRHFTSLVKNAEMPLTFKLWRNQNQITIKWE